MNDQFKLDLSQCQVIRKLLLEELEDSMDSFVAVEWLDFLNRTINEITAYALDQYGISLNGDEQIWR